MMATMTTHHPLTVGTTYAVTYHPTTTARTTTKTLTLTEAFETGAPHPVTGKRAVTYIFHGPKGGKVVLAPVEVIKAEAVA